MNSTQVIDQHNCKDIVQFIYENFFSNTVSIKETCNFTFDIFFSIV